MGEKGGLEEIEMAEVVNVGQEPIVVYFETVFVPVEPVNMPVFFLSHVWGSFRGREVIGTFLKGQYHGRYHHFWPKFT